MSGVVAASGRRSVVVVFARERAYTRSELAKAARALDLELVWATDRCHILAEDWPEGSIPVDLSCVTKAVAEVADALGDSSVVGSIGTDEQTAVLAAGLAVRLGLEHHGRSAAARTGDKLAFRRALSAAGCPQPPFIEIAPGDSDLALPLSYPLVIKPRCLAGSRGVMRADSHAELTRRRARLDRLLDDAELRGTFGDRLSTVIIEEFVPGPEVAFEGVLRAGELRTIAIFDKPDPLDGPFFAETIYVTPSSHRPEVVSALAAAVSAAAAAVGLTSGPVHAELRLGHDPLSPVVIELAARSIGGLCGRTLRIACGHSVEELVLASLAGIELEHVEEVKPAGVLMIPVDEPGVLLALEGLEEVRALDGIEEVEITAPEGRALAPLPEGNEYIGFAFARGEVVGEVVRALRQARALLRPRMKPLL